jgi:DeoR/GlpR family transcriptional regulator of sugar metabolism
MRAEPTLLRQWRILARLSHDGGQATIRQLVEHAAVSEKTIRRDIALLQSAGSRAHRTRMRPRIAPW